MTRTATFDDLPPLVELARVYHAERADGLPFDADFVREQFRKFCIDTVDGICIVPEQDGRIVGFLAATVTTEFCAPIRIAAALSLYVHPDHRGRLDALLDDYELWARWKGCVKASLSHAVAADARRNEAFARLYARRDYFPCEHAYLKDL